MGPNVFLDLNSLLSLPCYIFWKDLEGIYQGYNDYGAANLGYASGNEIIGKSDLDIFPKEHALIYQANDAQVITNKSPIFANEEGELKNHLPVIFHCNKIPIYTEGKLLIGILGVAMTTAAYKQGNLITPVENLSVIELADKLNYHCPSLAPNQITLSEREKACLHHLSQGLTIKEIAKQLELSPRTVETYMARVKEKLNCKNKTDLIFSFLRYLNNQPRQHLYGRRR